MDVAQQGCVPGCGPLTVKSAQQGGTQKDVAQQGCVPGCGPLTVRSTQQGGAQQGCAPLTAEASLQDGCAAQAAARAEAAAEQQAEWQAGWHAEWQAADAQASGRQSPPLHVEVPSCRPRRKSCGDGPCSRNTARNRAAHARRAARVRRQTSWEQGGGPGLGRALGAQSREGAAS